jgi:hypothetical protein
MVSVIFTISMAAFLQGHVQSSINSGSLIPENVRLDPDKSYWRLGGMNASPFLAAANLGAPLSLPVNYCIGRRVALGLSGVHIIASSLVSRLKSLRQIFSLSTPPRFPFLTQYLGMCIKAVGSPYACTRDCGRILKRIYSLGLVIKISLLQFSSSVQVLMVLTRSHVKS